MRRRAAAPDYSPGCDFSAWVRRALRYHYWLLAVPRRPRPCRWRWRIALWKAHRRLGCSKNILGQAHIDSLGRQTEEGLVALSNSFSPELHQTLDRESSKDGRVLHYVKETRDLVGKRYYNI